MADGPAKAHVVDGASKVQGLLCPAMHGIPMNPAAGAFIVTAFARKPRSPFGCVDPRRARNRQTGNGKP